MKTLGYEGAQIIRKRSQVWTGSGRGEGIRAFETAGKAQVSWREEQELVSSRCCWEQSWPVVHGVVLPPCLIPITSVLPADGRSGEVWCGGQDGGGARVHPAMQVVRAALTPTLHQQHLSERAALPGLAPGAAGSPGQRHPLRRCPGGGGETHRGPSHPACGFL